MPRAGGDWPRTQKISPRAVIGKREKSHRRSSRCNRELDRQPDFSPASQRHLRSGASELWEGSRRLGEKQPFEISGAAQWESSSTPTDNTNLHAASAVKAASARKEFNERWNAALDKVVPVDASGKAKVQPDTKVEYADAQGNVKTMSGKEWIEKQVKGFGYDNLTRWAISVGGNTGEQTLAMLAAYQSGDNSGIGVTARDKATIKTDKDETLGKGSSGMLEFSPSSDKSHLASLSAFIPTDSDTWENTEFKPVSALSGQYTRFSSSNDAGSHGGGAPPGGQPHHPVLTGDDKKDAEHFLTHVGNSGTAKKPEDAIEMRNRAWNMNPKNVPAASNLATHKVSREQALKDPFVLSTFDKCISCHVMYLDPKYDNAFAVRDSSGKEIGTRPPTARKLLTRASLFNALAMDGPGLQGFQKKINDMMGKNANQRHIHFSANEQNAIRNIIHNTESDPKTKPESETEELADQRGPTVAYESPAAKMLKQEPAIKYALFRCIECHRDPAVSETERENTFTKLRAAMMNPNRFNAQVLERMINYGYNEERLTHVKNLDNPTPSDTMTVLSSDMSIVHRNPDGSLPTSSPVMMKDKLFEFIKARDAEAKKAVQGGSQ